MSGASSAFIPDIVARVDVVNLASDPAGEVGEKVEAGAADVFNGDVAAERRIIFVPLHDVAEVADAARGEGLDRARGDGVDADALGTKVHRQIFDAGFKPGLGDAHHIIVRDHFFGAVIGQRQDRSARLHHRLGPLGDGDEAVDRDVHGHQEIVERRIDEFAAKLVLVGKADRVDDEIERVPLRLELRKGLVERFRAADVAVDEQARAELFGKRTNALFQSLALIGEGELSTFVRERLCNTPRE